MHTAGADFARVLGIHAQVPTLPQQALRTDMQHVMYAQTCIIILEPHPKHTESATPELGISNLDFHRLAGDSST